MNGHHIPGGQVLGEVAVSIPLTRGPSQEVWPVRGGPGKLRRAQGSKLCREWGNIEPLLLPAQTPDFSWGGGWHQEKTLMFAMFSHFILTTTL